jgi:hypothetical protein
MMTLTMEMTMTKFDVIEWTRKLEQREAGRAILQRHILNGTIKVLRSDDGTTVEYVGEGADGTEVSLWYGNDTAPTAKWNFYAYLAAHPTPDTW